MKKLVAFAIVAMIALGFTACGNDDTVDLLVWGPLGNQEFLNIAAERFAQMHPDTTFNFTFGVVGEGDALERVLEDPASAADIFAFADDQLRDFVNAGVLYEVTRNIADIRARNMDSAVYIATLDGRMWAYPQTADNGYFWYYDSSVISSDDVLTLDGIIEASLAANRRFTFPIDVAWVTASWFLAQGSLGLDGDRQVVDFNNAHGLAAAHAMIAMAESGAWQAGWAEELVEGIGTTLSGGVGGTWMAADIQATLGENFGVTKLPTATIGGRQVQLSSFMGTKLVGVNSQTEHPVYAMDFADFLTGEEMQLLSFEMNQIGPSNIAVAQHPSVLANPALAALAYQSMYAFPQRDVQGSYWGPVEAFGTHVVNGEVNTLNIQDLLDEMVAQIMGH
ncbi:MAG: extracellular solute-binding protein [Defluviitaleaceae bacterium]|nr:extracellular solute-binding protein [Defluviitaleaceae bacterium]